MIDPALESFAPLTTSPASDGPRIRSVAGVPARAPHRWLRIFAGAAGLVLLVLLAYWPLLHAGFIWDDDTWLVHNPLVQHWWGLRYIWLYPRDSIQYYPLVFTAFLLEYKLWGLNHLGYHLVNILLQAANAVLLWQVLKRLGLSTAWLIAATFAVHPVQVETVGWVVEQKNLLSALFYFAAVLAWMRFARIAPGDNPVVDSRPRTTPPHYHAVLTRDAGWYLLATLFYLLALSAKTDACTLPAVLLLLLWWKRGGFSWPVVGAVAAWLVIGGLAAAETVAIEHGQVGAHGFRFQWPLAERLFIAGKDLWFYPWKLLWPHPLLEIYPRWSLSHIATWQWTFPATAFLLPVVLLLLRRRIGRGPFTAVAFYGITIAPVLGFISFFTMVYTFVADHYQYVACIGLIALATEGLWFLACRFWLENRGGNQKPGTENRKLIVTVVVGSALPLILAWRTNVQSRIYSPPIHVWTHVLEYYPNCPAALEHVGAYECNHGDVTTGTPLLLRSFKLSQGNIAVIDSNVGDVYCNLLHQYAAATGYYRRALEVNPRYPYAIRQLVQCYARLGRWPQALAELREGLKLFPRSASLHLALANALAFGISKPDYRAAARQYQLALRYRPGNPVALYRLALTLEKLGRWPAALRCFQQMLRIAPRWAQGHFRYGQCLLAHGHPAAAAAQFRRTLELLPPTAAANRALVQRTLATVWRGAHHLRSRP